MSEQVILSEIMGEIKRTEKYLNKLKRAAASFGHTETFEPKKPKVHRHSIDHKAAQEEILRVILEQKKPWTVYGLFKKVDKKVVSNPQVIYRFTEKNPDIHMVGKKGRAVTYEYAPIEEAIEVKSKSKPRKKRRKLNPRGYNQQVVEDILRQNGPQTARELLPHINVKIKQDGHTKLFLENLAQTLFVLKKKDKIEKTGNGERLDNGVRPTIYGVKETRIHPGEQRTSSIFQNRPM